MKRKMYRIVHLVVAGIAMAIGFLIAFAIGECVMTTMENIISKL